MTPRSALERRTINIDLMETIMITPSYNSHKMQADVHCNWTGGHDILGRILCSQNKLQDINSKAVGFLFCAWHTSISWIESIPIIVSIVLISRNDSLQPKELGSDRKGIPKLKTESDGDANDWFLCIKKLVSLLHNFCS